MPSTNEGHYLAFGCVSELLHWEVFGCDARGAGPHPLDHASGAGRVDAHAGYYADARAKGHRVELLITEALGGVHGGFVRMLRLLEREVSRDGARDGTVYGRSGTAARPAFSSAANFAICSVTFVLSRTRPSAPAPWRVRHAPLHSLLLLHLRVLLQKRQMLLEDTL